MKDLETFSRNLADWLLNPNLNKKFEEIQNAYLHTKNGILPKLESPKESFIRLKEIFAKQYFEILKYEFTKNFNNDKQAIQEEVNKIESWIREAESFTETPVQDAFKNNSLGHMPLKDNEHAEYIRLKHDYYLRKDNRYNYCSQAFNGIPSKVYAQCFLFLPFLRSILKSSNNSKAFSNMKDLALFHYYSRQIINEDNSDDIAANNGRSNSGSGAYLLKNYGLYTDHSERCGNAGTATINKHRLERLDRVIGQLEKYSIDTQEAEKDRKRLIEFIP